MFEPKTCSICHGTGSVDTGNNDLPCECPLGDSALFNQASVIGPVTGEELRLHFMNGAPEPVRVGSGSIRAEDLPSRRRRSERRDNDFKAIERRIGELQDEIVSMLREMEARTSKVNRLADSVLQCMREWRASK